MSAGNQAHAGDPGSVVKSGDLRFLGTSVLLFSALTVVFFWRYAWSPTTTVSDPGDPLFLMWTMEWVRRAIFHAPRELFDAPMFHPLPDVLAYSDPLLPQALVAAPLRFIGFGPVAAYNAVYLGGIAAAGVITARLFFQLIADRTAALVGAVVATYPSLRLFHMAHMQLQVTTLLPLVLLLVHRVVRRPTAGNALGLALAIVTAALGSLYYGFFLAVLLPPFALAAWLMSPIRTARPLVALFGAGAASALALAPIARIYARAIRRLALERSDKGFCDLSDFFALHSFANISRWFPSLIHYDSGPQWVGGGAAILLPVAGLALAVLAIRGLQRNVPLPEWARVLLPYVVLGCLALALAVGPEVWFHGRTISKNPFGYISRLPGAREIRDYQRVGFIVAIAGGALVAVALAELKRRRRERLWALSLAFVGVTTVAPIFTTNLPAYQPPPPEALDPAYRWMEAQPDPFVFFEAPLPRRGEREPLEYMWAAIHHKKTMVHGFSGYLPLSDGLLRGEELWIDRPDFFRTLAVVGATHLLVHTDQLIRLPGGAATLARLRDGYGNDRVARFPNSEVYRVEAVPVPAVPSPSGHGERPTLATGGWADVSDCMETGTTAPPLGVYAPTVMRVNGIRFIPESFISELDDSLRIEVSEDLRTWRVAQHTPLLSSAMVAYLAHYAPGPWLDAAISPEAGSFIRLSSKLGHRIRICGLVVDAPRVRSVDFVPRTAMRLAASVSEESTGDALDGNPETRWSSQALQRGDEWIEVTFDREREVVAVLLELGKGSYDYGRKLALDCVESSGSTVIGSDVDGLSVTFERPSAVQVLPLAPMRSCRSLRVRQTGQAEGNYWSVVEISVLESAKGSPGR
jgi:hypothetical protein